MRFSGDFFFLKVAYFERFSFSEFRKQVTLTAVILMPFKLWILIDILFKVDITLNITEDFQDARSAALSTIKTFQNFITKEIFRK